MVVGGRGYGSSRVTKPYLPMNSFNRSFNLIAGRSLFINYMLLNAVRCLLLLSEAMQAVLLIVFLFIVLIVFRVTINSYEDSARM